MISLKYFSSAKIYFSTNYKNDSGIRRLKSSTEDKNKKKMWKTIITYMNFYADQMLFLFLV